MKGGEINKDKVVTPPKTTIWIALIPICKALILWGWTVSNIKTTSNPDNNKSNISYKINSSLFYLIII